MRFKLNVYHMCASLGKFSDKVLIHNTAYEYIQLNDRMNE